MYLSNRILIYDDITTKYRKTNVYNVYREALYDIICDKDKHVLIRELLDECKTLGLCIDGNMFIIKENQSKYQRLI